MPRAPKIIEETTGRLKRRTKAKFFKTKNLTLEQKKCIIEVCKNNKDMGMRKVEEQLSLLPDDELRAQENDSDLLVVSGGDIFDNEDEDDPLFGPLLPQTQFHFSKKI